MWRPEIPGLRFLCDMTDAFWDATNRIFRPYRALEMRLPLTRFCICYDEFEGYFKVYFPVLVARGGAIASGTGKQNRFAPVCIAHVAVAAFLNMVTFCFKPVYVLVRPLAGAS